MKKQELIDLGIADDVADKIFALHGQSIEKHKTAAETATKELETIKTQLTEANTQIEGFKGMKVEEIQKAADEYKTKFEQAQTDHAKELSDIKFNHALETSLTGAKAKNLKAVQALINREALALKDDGTLEGLDEQITKIKSENDYLFTDTNPPPKIVTGGNNQPVLGDAITNAARKAAGLVAPETK